MSHTLIIGMTESGKTTLAKHIAHKMHASGICIIVLDPLNDPGWRPKDVKGETFFQTSDKKKFVDVVKSSRGCAVFIDEAGESVGQYDKEMHWLGTRSRHYGHSTFFIAQRATMIGATPRGQCSNLYLFNTAATDCKLLADEWNKPEIRTANTLLAGEFFAVSRFGPIKKGKIDFGTKEVYIIGEG